MREPRELRKVSNQKETLLGKYINSLMTGNIKNLTIKEDYIMLEALKAQREVYAAEVERLNGIDLNTLVNERFELIKEQITTEVLKEHEEKLSAAELNVKHYDFVIETMEAKAVAEVEEETEAEEEVIENMEV